MSQLRFELPVTAKLGGLGLPDLGVSQHPLAGSALANDYSMTILDSVEHRLLAWGITVGHSAERDGWVLRAPRWEPDLPAERFCPGPLADPPAALTQIIRPFLRDAELRPITTRNVTQTVTALMNPVGLQLAEVVDRTIEVVLAGETALRYRELLIAGGGLAPVQAAALREIVAEAGGQEVSVFPTLGNRLGVDDYPPIISEAADAQSLGDFVIDRLIRRWAEIALAAATGGDSELHSRLTALSHDLVGLDWALKKSWRNEIRPALAAAWAEPTKYLAVLDALDLAVSTRPVKDAEASATTAFTEEIGEALDGVLETACIVEANSANPKWRQAVSAADRAYRVVRVARPLLGDRSRKLAKRLATYQEALSGCVVDERSVDLTEMTVAEAFAAGQRYQQMANAAATNRAAFLASWMKLWQGIKRMDLR